ncbi:MAG: hypothetical protein HY821_23085 [Acidobacteria bacterium]|nr:hypothetical protein [Acidobacteriota bacterium]
MSPVRLALVFLSLLAAAPALEAVTLVKAATLRSRPSSCSAFLADSSPSVTSYAASDTAVVLYFVVSGQQVGDVASVNYIQPNGAVYAPASGPWAPVASNETGGQLCYSDAALEIAAANPALQAGQWSAKVYYNSTLIATLNFTIGSSTPSTGTNLLKNPGAEDGNASPDYSGLSAIPSWTTDGGVSVISWTSGADYLSPSSPGPTDRGRNFFSGGYSSTASMYQVVDLSSYSSAIDAGTQPYTLSGWLGGWDGQDDNATLTATFKDSSGATLGTAKIGPVLSADRSGNSGLLQRISSANLPARTRSATITAAFTRTSGSSNDGYADNFNFSLVSTSGGGGGTTCTFALTPASANVAAGGGTGQIQITTGAGCQWTATISVPWIALGLFSTSGTGSGSLSYNVSANTTTASRTGTITIGGQVFTITQAAPAANCPYSVTLSSTSIAAAGGSLLASITTTAGCQWTASSDASWARPVTAAGTGSGAVNIVVDANTTTSARTARLTIAGVNFTVTQAAAAATCTYNVTLSSTSITASAGTVTATITVASGCQWTAASDASWIRPSPTSGSGNGTVSFAFDANTATSARTARLTVAGVNFTITQAAAAQTCTYNASLASNSVPATAGTVNATVTTQSGCQWSASSDSSWVRPSPNSGTGSGTVTFGYDANTATSSRSARLTVAGTTFTLTQAAAAPVNCTFTVSPSKISLDYKEQYGFIEITASAPACRWTATSSDSWFSITPDYASGAGSATITYYASENQAEARTATATVAGQNIPVTQAANPSKAGPPPTVVSAASRLPASLPSGAIARGSTFSVLEKGIGPTDPVSATSYPLDTTLGGVSVKIKQGENTFDAYPVLASSTQVDAVLPSVVPEGDATATVSYDGKTMEPVPFKVVNRNFGVFTTARGSGPAKVQLVQPDGSLVWASQVITAKPGQEALIWGTGLGPVDGGDNVVPPQGNMASDVQVLVAGLQAQVLYAGRSATTPGQDVVRIVLPPETPSGCYVPVQVNLPGYYGNMATIAVNPEGKQCSDPTNPFSGLLTTGRKGGSIFLLRGNFVGTIDAEKGVQDVTLDAGLAIFLETPGGGGEQAFNPLVSMPPPGSCTSYTGVADPTGLSSVASASGSSGAIGKVLDAGETITITHPSGQKVTLEGPAADEDPGAYGGFFGGNIPGSEDPPKPLFFTPGTYRVTGTGGRDVGAFETTINVPPPVEWTNKAEMTAIDRAAGVTFTWSTPTTPQRILLGAAATDQTTKAASGFFCVVPGGTGRFTVPPNVLAHMPPTVDPDPKKTGAGLIFGTLPADDIAKFTATGIDQGQIYYGLLGTTLVQVK